MNKKTLIALGVSIALNCALLGFVIAKGVYEPKYPLPPPQRDIILPDAQPQHPMRPEKAPSKSVMLRAFKDAFRNVMKDNKGKMDAAKKDVADALRAEPFDQDTLKAAMEKANKLRKEIDEAVQASIFEQIGKMTPEERRAFADKFDCGCKGQPDCPCAQKRAVRSREIDPGMVPTPGSERHRTREERRLPPPEQRALAREFDAANEIVIIQEGQPAKIIRNEGAVVMAYPEAGDPSAELRDPAQAHAIHATGDVSAHAPDKAPCGCKSGQPCPCMDKGGSCACGQKTDPVSPQRAGRPRRGIIAPR